MPAELRPSDSLSSPGVPASGLARRFAAERRKVMTYQPPRVERVILEEEVATEALQALVSTR